MRLARWSKSSLPVLSQQRVPLNDFPTEVFKQLPVKIALVSPYDFVYPGGVNIHVSSLERQFTKMGHDVRIIAPASGKVSGFDDKFIRIGTPVPIPAGGTICRLTISPRLGPTIKTVLKKENFDIIHLHEPFMPMLCSAVLRFSNTANVATFHAFEGKPGYKYGKPVSTILIRRRLHKLDGKIAVSKAAMAFASKYVRGYYNIIPNGVDTELFSPNVSPLDEFGDGKLNILFVGRLEKQKGVNYLIKAYKLVKREIPNSRLIVVGPGVRLRRKYEKQVIRDKLEDVIFVGGKSQEELPRYYKTADIFCAPATDLESFGIVLLEAMAVSKPVVATNIEGYNSVVTNGDDGLLVSPRDAQGLAQALISLLTDQSLRQQMGARGRLKAEQYDWKLVAQQVLDYYLRVLGEPPWNKQFPELKPTSISV
jgi:phosphatidylinositol alpha-mannosyltransferase